MFGNLRLWFVWSDLDPEQQLSLGDDVTESGNSPLIIILYLINCIFSLVVAAIFLTFFTMVFCMLLVICSAMINHNDGASGGLNSVFSGSRRSASRSQDNIFS